MIPNKPTKSNPPFYFYAGKGWKLDTKIKVNGKFYKLTHCWYETLAEARNDYQAQVERRVEALTPKAARGQTLWEDFVETYLNYRRTQVRGSSLAQDKIHIRAAFDPMFKGKPVGEAFKRASASAFQKAVQERKANRKNKNRLLGYYLRMLDYAFEHELLEEDADYRRCKSEITPIKSTEQEDEIHERQVLTGEQCDRLLEAISDAQDKMLTALMMNTGLRIGEALAIRFSDFDFDGLSLNVSRTVSVDEFGQPKQYNRTKTKLGNRTIPLQRQFVLMALSYCAAFGYRASDLLFPSRDDKSRAMDSSAYRIRLNGYCESAGVPRITPHSLRHTFATLLSQKCYSDAQRTARAYIMGHSVAVDEAVYTAHNQIEVAKAMIGE